MQSLPKVFRPASTACRVRAMGTMNVVEVAMKPSLPGLKGKDIDFETTWCSTHLHDAKPSSDASYSSAKYISDDALSSSICFFCGKGGHWSKECPSIGTVAARACPCGAGACRIRAANSEKNRGRLYYSCPLGKDERNCGFFEWCDGLKEATLPCPCGAGLCRSRTAKTTKNSGRTFYTCPRPAEESCGFFKWSDELIPALATSDSENKDLRISKEGTSARDGQNIASEGYCILPPSNKPIFGSVGTCFRCGEVGHWAKGCPNQQASNRFSESYGDDDKFFADGIKLDFQGRRARVFLDGKPDGYIGQGLLRGESVGKGTCFRCGGHGHWARECTL